MKKALFLVTLLIAASFPLHGAVVVSEQFGGLAADGLDGTTADIFDSAITNAGGSSSWEAATGFKADGSITAGDSFGYLDLGTYINDRMGTANGKFTLTVTLSQPTGDNWLSLGFYNSASTSSNFASGTKGLGTSLFRSATSSGSEYYLGPGTADNSDAGTLSGTVTFTTVYDFTPDGGYDPGSNNYGTVTFSNSANSNTFTDSYGGTSPQNFQYLAFGAANGTTGSYDSLELSVIPEPSSVLLLGLGALGLLFLRRRAS